MIERERDEHDEHINKLAMKVGTLLDGELAFDAAAVCGMVAAYSLALSFSDRPDAARESFATILKFMVERFEVCLQSHSKMN
jgi:hypothetical protein